MCHCASPGWTTVWDSPITSFSSSSWPTRWCTVCSSRPPCYSISSNSGRWVAAGESACSRACRRCRCVCAWQHGRASFWVACAWRWPLPLFSQYLPVLRPPILPCFAPLLSPRLCTLGLCFLISACRYRRHQSRHSGSGPPFTFNFSVFIIALSFSSFVKVCLLILSALQR